MSRFFHVQAAVHAQNPPCRPPHPLLFALPQVSYMHRSASKETFSVFLQKYRIEVFVFVGIASTRAQRPGAFKFLSRCRNSFPRKSQAVVILSFRSLKLKAAFRVQAAVRGAIARAAFRSFKVGSVCELVLKRSKAEKNRAVLFLRRIVPRS